LDWDERYRQRSRIWGDGPSELAVIAAESLPGRPESIVDLGCGYGRDAEYLAGRLGCRVLGIDSSAEAIYMARDGARDGGAVEYRCCDFAEVDEARHDAVLASNLYHLLGDEDRRRLAEAVPGLLKPGGLLFLNAVSARDPHHFGGAGAEQCDGRSGEHVVMPSSEDELKQVFGCLDVKELYEHKYIEPHANGKLHHHISWILVAERP
jgi:SAM-dependent methyltransferase